MQPPVINQDTHDSLDCLCHPQGTRTELYYVFGDDCAGVSPLLLRYGGPAVLKLPAQFVGSADLSRDGCCLGKTLGLEQVELSQFDSV